MLDLNNLQTANSIVVSTEDVIQEEDNTVIVYGTEDLFVTPAQRQGKSFADILTQYGHLIGMTFNRDKMTLRRETINEDENVMVNFDQLAVGGTFLLNSGSDSKGN